MNVLTASSCSFSTSQFSSTHPTLPIPIPSSQPPPSHLGAQPNVEAAHGEVVRAAVAVVVATRGGFHGATPVSQAEGSDGHGAAAGGPSRALVGAVTHLHGWGWGGGGRWAGRGVVAGFDGVGRLHGDPALAVNGGRVPDETDVTGFAPIRSPRVLDGPVGGSGFGSVTDCQHTVVELVTAGVVKDALRGGEGGFGFRVCGSEVLPAKVGKTRFRLDSD